MTRFIAITLLWGGLCAAGNGPFGVSDPGDVNGDGKVDIADLVAAGEKAFYVEAEFIRGDLNGDGKIDVADVPAVLTYLFNSKKLNPTQQTAINLCPDKADVNDDGRVDIADAVRLMTYLFGRGPLPPPPFPAPGSDPTDDSLGCKTFKS